MTDNNDKVAEIVASVIRANWYALQAAIKDIENELEVCGAEERAITTERGTKNIYPCLNKAYVLLAELHRKVNVLEGKPQ